MLGQREVPGTPTQAAQSRSLYLFPESSPGVEPAKLRLSSEPWVGVSPWFMRVRLEEGDPPSKQHPGGPGHRAWLTGHLPADAPWLTELPRNVTVELGRSALLPCRAVGRPPPSVTWRRGDSQPLGPGRASRTGQPNSVALFFESKRWGLGRASRGCRVASHALSP